MTETDALVKRLREPWDWFAEEKLMRCWIFDRSVAAARIERQSAAIDRLTKRVRELEGALRFYAEGSFTGGTDGSGFVRGFCGGVERFDDGDIARAALTSEPPPDPAS